MKHLLLYISVALAIYACAPASSNYRKSNGIVSKQLTPSHVLYHVSKDSSYIYTQVNTNQLLYNRKNQSFPFKAAFEIEIIVFQNNIAIDTLRNIFTDIDNNQEAKIILAKTSIELIEGEKYWLEINTKDAARKETISQHISFEKAVSVSANYFLIKDRVTQLPIVNNVVKPGQRLTIESPLYSDSLKITYLATAFELAAAPYTANSTIRIRFDEQVDHILNKEDNKWEFTIPEKTGIVRISSTSGLNASYYLSVLPNSFPKLRDYESMTELLRYITTNSEYNKIVTAENKREAFENFWLTCARNKEKAKILINEYYLRAERANQFFTSYKEGWKTDRGIIFIVYGKPHQIYNNNNSETWLYGDETNPLSLNFTFDKQNNPYSNNDYVLRRSPTYQSSWYVAIERWRDGRIYN